MSKYIVFLPAKNGQSPMWFICPSLEAANEQCRGDGAIVKCVDIKVSEIES